MARSTAESPYSSSTPTPITAYMSVAVKAASFAMMVRFFVISLEPLRPQWVMVLTIVSALDIFGGSGVRYEDCVAFNRRAASAT